MEKLPIKKGCLLLLGISGGRRAMAFDGMGFNVTGVNYIAELVDKTVQNLANAGIKIQGMVEEISNLHVERSFYDVAWLSSEMYSCIPGRQRRVDML